MTSSSSSKRGRVDSAFAVSSILAVGSVSWSIGRVGFRGQIDRLQGFEGGISRFRDLAGPAERSDHRVFEHGHIPHRSHNLERSPDAETTYRFGSIPRDRPTFEADGAGGRLERPRDQVEAGGLARTIGTDQRRDSMTFSGRSSHYRRPASRRNASRRPVVREAGSLADFSRLGDAACGLHGFPPQQFEQRRPTPSGNNQTTAIRTIP